MKTAIIITIILYILLLFDFHASLTTKNNKYLLEYNGLFWVTLDYWTIFKYKSPDKPMKWIHFQKLKETT